jgi:hypothetical protein
MNDHPCHPWTKSARHSPGTPGTCFIGAPDLNHTGRQTVFTNFNADRSTKRLA